MFAGGCGGFVRSIGLPPRWDNTGNSMLSGTFYFRQVFYVPDQTYAQLDEAVTLYGTFDYLLLTGRGTTTIQRHRPGRKQAAARQWRRIHRCTATEPTLSPRSGYGFLYQPLCDGEITCMGLVSANGRVCWQQHRQCSRLQRDLFIAAQIAESSARRGIHLCRHVDRRGSVDLSGRIALRLHLSYRSSP